MLIAGGRAEVTGSFVSGEASTARRDDGTPDISLRLRYLTPQTAPVTLNLREILPPTFDFYRASAADVERALEDFFGRTPYEATPKPPAPSKHKMPPSERRAAARLGSKLA